MIDLANWAGNYRFGAARLHRPRSVAELQEVVRGCRKARVVGTRHSFNGIADTDGDLISLEEMPLDIAVDVEGGRVTVGGGVRYGELCGELGRHGLAIHNLASLPHISVAGACATATHGSGDRNGCLATAVAGLELMTADGEVVRLARGDESFVGAVANLGALGVVTRVTLETGPEFMVRQDVYENLEMARLETDFDRITSSGYSVSLFTDWRSDTLNQVWVKQITTAEDRSEAPEELFGAARAARALHPIGSLSAENCTEQRGAPGGWSERLPHFRLEYTPSIGEELQSEYLVPRRHAVEAIRAVHGLRKSISPLLQISEIRTVAADLLWMSPFYREDCIGIHFTWVKDWTAVSELLPRLEESLLPFGARPHWGKLFTMSGKDLEPLYPRMQDFRRLAETLDPTGKFCNRFLDATVFCGST